MKMIKYRFSQRAFTLVEIMLAMVVLTIAIVPVVALFYSNMQDTDYSLIYNDATHDMKKIMDTLLEQVSYIALYEMMENGPIVNNKLHIEDFSLIVDTNEVGVRAPVFLKSDLATAEFNYEPGSGSWKYADEFREIYPIYYNLEFSYVEDLIFHYLENDPQNPPDEASPGSVELNGWYDNQVIPVPPIKIVLTAVWEAERRDRTRGTGAGDSQRSYSLVSFKAYLDH